MTGFFITGTDTDAGKTHVGRALLAGARALGITAAGYKPIESGCSIAGQPGPDAGALATAAGTEPLTSYTLKAPVSPHLAARQDGVTLDLDEIQTRVTTLKNHYELLLVEGAGGFLVPVTDYETMADLATALDLPILIVAANRLGAINHSLLTIEAARSRGLVIAGLILSNTSRQAGQGLENAEAIRDYGKVPVLAMPHTETDAELTRAGSQLLQTLLANAEAGEERI